jgi:hypothetical protein
MCDITSTSIDTLPDSNMPAIQQRGRRKLNDLEARAWYLAILPYTIMISFLRPIFPTTRLWTRQYANCHEVITQLGNFSMRSSCCWIHARMT